MVKKHLSEELGFEEGILGKINLKLRIFRWNELFRLSCWIFGFVHKPC